MVGVVDVGVACVRHPPPARPETCSDLAGRTLRWYRRRRDEMATQTAKPKSGKKSRVSAEEFVKVWQNSNSLNEVSERTGISAAYANSRACRYRKNGVPLKKFP